ncbi:MAG TPA: LacI family DNA-binding transcriptional regulator [Ignavibacteriaceae bacterium]|nr:LacI family DNA-binding transcriptional regulator [Ignavibacteriaceae bacterium]
MMNPTIKDVAKMANVSIATVSLVVHNHKRISQETKNKVLTAIEQLNYHPSHSARGLVRRNSGNVGFVLTDDHFLRTEPFYTHIFIGAEFEAHENELYVLLTTINSEFNSTNKLPRFILERNIDGLIIAGKVPFPFIEQISKYNFPIIFVDYSPCAKKYSGVLVDNIQGGELATEHLIKSGHERIAFIGGDIEHPSIKDRLNGYKNSFEKFGLKLNDSLIEIEEDYPGRTNGYNAAERLFTKNKDITAIFSCNDAMAVGAMQYMKDNGIKIPDDCSIIGFDDVVSDNAIEPALSTIRVPKMEMGTEAMKLMAHMIKNNLKDNRKVLLPVDLIIRESTKRI